MKNSRLNVWSILICHTQDHYYCTHHSFQHPPKHDVTSIKPRGLDSSDEELGSISVFASISHAQPSWSVVLQLEVLIGKLLPIDTLAWRELELRGETGESRDN